jgi:uncharacterized protein (TIGR02147 family)
MLDKTVSDFINRIFQEINTRRPGYSLRAFARDLDLSPSFLSMLMREKSGLSIEQAHKISKALQLNDKEKEHLLLLTEAEFSRSFSMKKKAREKLAKISSERSFKTIDDNYKEIIQDWIHPAILEFCQIKSGKMEPDEISHFFERSIDDVKRAIQRLVKAGLLEFRHGLYVVQEVNYQVTPGELSYSVQNFHRQLMHRALISMERDPFSHRFLNSYVIKVKKEKLDQMQKKLEALVEEFVGGLSDEKEADHIFGVSFQFFPLSRLNERE